jgi:hypothetical protein
MATITINYDGRNKSINKLIDVIVDLGGKKNEVIPDDIELAIQMTASRKSGKGNLVSTKAFLAKAE